MPAPSVSVGRSRRARRLPSTLAYQITAAETRERERIALGLHDEIGQFLTLARLKLGELRETTDTYAAKSLLDELGSLLSQASRATRSATFDLYSPVLRLGLEQALRSLGERLARDSRLNVSIDCRLAPLTLPETMLAVLFRGVRELCLNVQKHARARSVRLTARSEGRQLCVRLSDDGVGFGAAPAAGTRFDRGGGFGLFSTRLQMQAIGGRLEIGAAPGGGTCATILLPLPG